MKLSIALALAIITLVSPARAEDIEARRAEAAALQKRGAAQLKKRDVTGALDSFLRGYQAFASPKILKNIGSAFAELGRPAEAANVYQRWLDDPGADSTQRSTVQQALVALDAKVGLVTVTGLPADAELQLDPAPVPWVLPGSESPWMTAAQTVRWRVPAGEFTIRARKPGFQPAEHRGTVSPGARVVVPLSLVELAPQVAPTPMLPPLQATADRFDHDDEDRAAVRSSRSPSAVQLGALVDVAIDGNGEGVAVMPGLGVRLADRAELAVRASLGGSMGLQSVATVFLFGRTLRPQLSAGVPIFFSDGLRIGVRGAAGLCLELASRLSAIVEVGAEYFVNPEMDRVDFVLVPIVGMHARL